MTRTRRQVLEDLHELQELAASVREELRSIMEDRAEAMRQLVDEHGMTTYELAHAIHLSQPRVSQIILEARLGRYR